MADTPYFDPAPVQAVWKEHKAGVRDWRFELWNVLTFKLGGKPGGFRCFDIRFMRSRQGELRMPIIDGGEAVLKNLNKMRRICRRWLTTCKIRCGS